MMLNQGVLPTQVKCDRELVEDTFKYLSNGDEGMNLFVYNIMFSINC
jgi:hypothetical protein